MHRYFIRFAYSGTNYHGWQIQENAHTIQAEFESALSNILSSEIKVTGAGRTDTGVHAKEMFAHFDNSSELHQGDLCYKLNRFLPDDIVVYDILSVKPNAHARFDAIKRTYNYIITNNKNPFEHEFSWHLHYDLDIDKMNEFSVELIKHKDFSSFCKSHTDTKTNLCDIFVAKWKNKNGLIVFEITANRFLRNMVRAIVGTMVDVGRGKINLEEFKQIIESKNRSDAGMSVPAKGLFLTKIEYPNEIFN